MTVNLIDTHLLVIRSRSSAKAKVKYDSLNFFQKMAVLGALVFLKKLVFSLFSVLLKAFDHVDNHSNTTTATKAQTTATKTTTTTTTTSPPLPLIYLITPTVYRTEQKADLTRLSHTLRLVSRIHWIVVEDRPSRSLHVANFLANCKVPYTHLAVKTSYAEIARLKLMGHLKGTWVMPKGVEQRNLALEWITQNGEFPSVFYPLDDDNTYDLQIFEEVKIKLC